MTAQIAHELNYQQSKGGKYLAADATSMSVAVPADQTYYPPDKKD